jgi:PPOX class probable F420-dependent enzyme
VTELSDDVVKFLSEGTRTGTLAWTAADGRPLVAPVWYVVEDGVIVLNTGTDSAKARAFARDPRVAFSVDDRDPPYGFVQVQGTAESSDDADDLYRVAAACGARYLGADRADEFGKRNGVPGVLVIRIRPTKVIAHFDML